MRPLGKAAFLLTAVVAGATLLLWSRNPELPLSVPTPQQEGPHAATPAIPLLGDVAFQVGAHGFLNGDSLTISKFLGDSPILEVGGTYVVTGRYTLASTEEVELAVSLTNGAIGTPTRDSNKQRVVRGIGEFELSFTVEKPGYPHISFYPLRPPRQGIGGVYFGDEAHLLRSAKWYEELNGLDAPVARAH